MAAPVVDRSPDGHRPRPTDLGRTLIDLRVPADDATLAAVAVRLACVGVTALIGEHVDDPAGTTPTRSATRLASVGLPAIVTVSGRTRSPDEHRAEIERLAAAGVAAIHCVTGDHPAARFGPDAEATFTLDGVELAGIARDSGAVVSVAETPTAPPVSARPERIVVKQSAGADLVVLNHGGAPATMIDFADRCRAAGASLALVAPVPVITDRASAHALEQFPGLELPDGLVARVVSAADPVETGIAAAAELGRELLASGRFAAVNLSGSARAGGPVERAEIMTEVARRVA